MFQNFAKVLTLAKFPFASLREFFFRKTIYPINSNNLK